MSHGFVESTFVLNNLIPDTLQDYTILDIGLGYGFWGWAVSTWKEGTFQLHGIEVVTKRVERMNKLNIYTKIFEGDLRKILPTLPPKTYDLTILSHVIEHLPKKEGMQTINELKRVTKGRVLIMCPVGDTIDETGMSRSTKFDAHRSAWYPVDFKERGFQVKQLRFSHRAGRVVSLFEIIYYKLKGVDRGGRLVAWWDCAEGELT